MTNGINKKFYRLIADIYKDSICNLPRKCCRNLDYARILVYLNFCCWNYGSCICTVFGLINTACKIPMFTSIHPHSVYIQEIIEDLYRLTNASFFAGKNGVFLRHF